MTSSEDFLYEPNDFVKGTYGSMKEFESFAFFVCVYLFVAFLALAFF